MKSKTYMRKYHSEPEPVWVLLVKIIACLSIVGMFLGVVLV